MILAEVNDANITRAAQFRVTGRTATMELRCADAGVRVTLYVVHPIVVYYGIRFATIGTRHVASGPISISAYTFDDATRDFTNIRMSVDAFRPLHNIYVEGNLLPTNATRVRVRNFLDQPLRKLNFVIKKYIWENHESEEIVPRRAGFNIESFASSLSDPYEDLVDAALISEGCNPVLMNETVTRRRINNNRDSVRQHSTTYIHNPRVTRINWDHPDFNLVNITNDRQAFTEGIFFVQENAS